MNCMEGSLRSWRRHPAGLREKGVGFLSGVSNIPLAGASALRGGASVTLSGTLAGDYFGITFEACGPFGPSFFSNSTS